MKVTVFTTDGKASGKTAELDDAIFAIQPNETVMYEDVRRYRSNQRQGTAKTKQRSEIAGSTRKLFRQKGTGGARRGDIKSPLLRGGGTVFGPTPRDYTVNLTKKMIQLARKSALSVKASKEAIRVIEDFNFDAPKTQEMVRIIRNLEVAGKKVLLLTNGTSSVLYKSGRNIPGVSVLEANKPATYEILNADVIVIQEGAIAMLEGTFASKFTTPAPKKSERPAAKATKTVKGSAKATTSKPAKAGKADAVKTESAATAAPAATAPAPAQAKEAAPAKKATAKKAEAGVAKTAAKSSTGKTAASTAAKSAKPAKADKGDTSDAPAKKAKTTKKDASEGEDK